ncbi:DUF5686 and carboxypeptidase regulatory-like domain-containing protein [Hymenobacter sp.]|uniref:DUF5686 and carboxypeptidase regulatory-like domain-containing protein n=1 Tax=Hymenobacter sp. TaxID=1898978 RepID=UPI00286C306C|nr:DUF5686 and carboxypeptidase regulatory-like domain-containing protein [Hymenobacter sp.]
MPGRSHAGIIRGTVSGADKAGLAFANVAVRGSATSTGSNEQGEYQLRLPAGAYELVFQYVGYRPQIQAVRVLGGDSVLTVNVALQPEAYNLGEVVVKSTDRDPAYAIIQQAQQWRAYHRREVAAYRARIYIKALGRINETPGKVLGLFKLGPDIKPGIFYLSESLSDISFTQPNTIKERMLSSRISGDSRGISFNRASAGRNLGFYENLIKPAFSERGFVSPIAANAMLFYKYELVGSTPRGGEVVHKIRVIPRRRTDPVFSGFIYIVDASWRIHSVDLNLDKDAQIDYVDDLHIAQQYAPAPGNPNVWLIQSQQVRANLSGLGFKGSGYITAVLSNYANVVPTYPAPPTAKAPPVVPEARDDAPAGQETAAQIRKRKPDLRGLNAQVRKQVKRAQRDSVKADPFAQMPRGQVQLVEKGVNERDSSYWDAVRPVPLTAEELKDYRVKDSSEVIRRSRPYQDSMDRKRNKFEPINLLLGGYTYLNTFRKRSVTVLPVAQIFQYNTVEGAVLNAQATFSQRTETRQFFTLTPTLRYGFSSEELNPSLAATWQLHPAKLQQISVAAGRTIENFDRNSQLTPAINTIYTLYANRNYAKLYRRDGAEVTYLTEPVNGLNLRAAAGYFDRRELANTTVELMRDVPGRAFTANQPVSEELPGGTGFGRSQVLTVGLSLDYRPGQRYISRPDGKFNLGSKWPTFNVQGRLAVPDVLGADVRYLLLQAGVRDNLPLGLLGTSNFRVNVGGFVGRQQGMTFADYRHFSGNQTILTGSFSNFQLLDYYRFSTNNTYLEAHYDHHFNGFFLNNIPLLRKLKWQEVASLNYLRTARVGHYVELGVGIEHILKVVRVDFYGALQSGERVGTGLRLGFGF